MKKKRKEQKELSGIMSRRALMLGLGQALLGGVLVGAVVAFLVGSFILKVRPVPEEDDDEEEEEAGAAVPGLG